MSSLTILLVDDNPGDQMLVAKALEASNRGTNLEIVSDGEAALTFLRKRGPHRDSFKPNLIILDLNIPKVSGSEVLSELRGEPTLRDIPVVLVTGAKATPEMKAICELNPNFYVVKPEGIDPFFAMIRAIEEYGINMIAIPKREKEHSEKLRQQIAA